MSEQFDSLQEARAEIARLRQENGDLGEKCGALLAQQAELQAIVQALVYAGGIMRPSIWFDRAELALAKLQKAKS